MTNNLQQLQEEFETKPCSKAIYEYGQLDGEGIMVSASRQAIHETMKLAKEYITLAYNLGVKDSVEALPDGDSGIHPDTGMKQYLPFNKGTTVGWNEYREEAITKLNKLIQ